MVQESDWRYENAKYHDGAELSWSTYESPTPEWDHDHCVACWQKFSEVGDPPEVLNAGYRTADDDWVCPECFSDLNASLHWTVISGAPPVE
jgi:rubredoxin